jgi:hypothetical protein
MGQKLRVQDTAIDQKPGSVKLGADPICQSSSQGKSMGICP